VAFLEHCIVVGVSQTLRRRTEGATYVRQGATITLGIGPHSSSVLFCCERKWTKNNSVFNWKVLLFKFTKYGAHTIKVMWWIFSTVACRISSWLKWYKNYKKNRLRLAKVIVRNKLPRFFMVHCVEWTTVSYIPPTRQRTTLNAALRVWFIINANGVSVLYVAYQRT